VKTCDEAIAQENDHLKLEVKRLEKIVSELVKQAKVRSSQDNHRNMVNKFEKGSTITCL
jgi:regulator of replication initiation timing